MSKKQKIITISVISVVFIGLVALLILFFLNREPQHIYEMTDFQIMEAEQEIVEKDYEPVVNDESGKIFEIEKDFYDLETGKYVLEYDTENNLTRAYYSVPEVVVFEDVKLTETDVLFDKDEAREKLKDISNQIYDIAEKQGLDFFIQYNIALNNNTETYEEFTSADNFLDDFYQVDDNELSYITYAFKDKEEKLYVFTLSKQDYMSFELIINLS